MSVVLGHDGLIVRGLGPRDPCAGRAAAGDTDAVLVTLVLRRDGRRGTIVEAQVGQVRSMLVGAVRMGRESADERFGLRHCYGIQLRLCGLVPPIGSPHWVRPSLFVLMQSHNGQRSVWLFRSPNCSCSRAGAPSRRGVVHANQDCPCLFRPGFSCCTRDAKRGAAGYRWSWLMNKQCSCALTGTGGTSRTSYRAALLRVVTDGGRDWSSMCLAE